MIAQKKTFGGLRLVILILFSVSFLRASDLDMIGVTLLRQIDPTLKGSGVKVAQAESQESLNAFEVNPGTVGQPQSLFTWISAVGSSTNFPNLVGSESGHAGLVGDFFYSPSMGVAPEVNHVDNYDADYFYESVINQGAPPTIRSRVVNQSFIFGGESQAVNQSYDDYAADHNTIFVSAAGNGGAPDSPASSYNGIGVGAFNGSSSIGPTVNGRCKPDITAPNTVSAAVTSLTTPYVAGGATVLVQAGGRGDGGAETNAATDLRTVKALLLNGAVKPSDWTNGVATPLDARYGAGILNAFNSWKQLAAGRKGFIETTTNSNGGAHPPGSETNNVAGLVGWDFNAISTSPSGHTETVNHYYLNLPAAAGSKFTLTATLVWNRPSGQTSINNLNLFLHGVPSGSLAASSVSGVDNVEHLFIKELPAGRYDLQVLKDPVGRVSNSETYALAFEVFNVSLSIARTNSNVTISWPVAPAGFRLQSSTNLTSPSWSDVAATISSTASQSSVLLPLTTSHQFFRLQRP